VSSDHHLCLDGTTVTGGRLFPVTVPGDDVPLALESGYCADRSSYSILDPVLLPYLVYDPYENELFTEGGKTVRFHSTRNAWVTKLGLWTHLPSLTVDDE